MGAGEGVGDHGSDETSSIISSLSILVSRACRVSTTGDSETPGFAQAGCPTNNGDVCLNPADDDTGMVESSAAGVEKLGATAARVGVRTIPPRDSGALLRIPRGKLGAAFSIGLAMAYTDLRGQIYARAKGRTASMGNTAGPCSRGGRERASVLYNCYSCSVGIALL